MGLRHLTPSWAAANHGDYSRSPQLNGRDPRSRRESHPVYRPLASNNSDEHAWDETQHLDLQDYDLGYALPSLGAISSRNSSMETPLGIADWRPISLKGWFLWTNIGISIGLTAGVYAILYGVGDDRQASLTNENAHLLSVFVPTLLATISWQLFRSVFFEALRMLPYFRMADQKGTITGGAFARKSVGGSFFPYPMADYADDPWIKWPAQIILLIGNFLVASKAVFIGSQRTVDGWILTIHPRAAYYLMAAYTLMTLFYVFIYFWARGKSTGLKWDPATNLDHLALIWRTNAMSEISLLPLDYKKARILLSRHKTWRLGYWKQQETSSTGTRDIATVYGIGTLHTASSESTHSGKGPWCDEYSTCTSETHHCRFGLHIFAPISHPIVRLIHLALLAAAIFGLAYASYQGAFRAGFQLKGAWLHAMASRGWLVVGGVAIHSDDSVSAALLLRALPTFMAGYFANGVVASIDITMRDNQCFSDLALGPLPSRRSLGLDYVTKLSVLVPIAAIAQGHHRLAFVATVSTIAPLAPVFVAGLFVFESPAKDTMLVSFAKVSLVVFCAYILLFMASLVVAWPRKRERLLRQRFTIADTVRPFLHTWLMDEPVLDAAMNEREPEKFQAKVLLAEYLYQLGIIEHATCGGSHLGVELVGNEAGQRFRHVVPVEKLLKRQEQHRKKTTRRSS